MSPVKNPISLALADDHPLVVSGLLTVLGSSFHIIGTGGNGLELLQLVHRKQPDIALIDLNMPVMDGREACKRISKTLPGIKCVVFSWNYNRAIAADLKQIGVRGYLTKDIDGSTLVNQLKRIALGEVIYEEEVHMTIPYRSSGTSPARDCNISERELEIIRLVRNGHTSREISNQLFISVSTVETHRKNIYKKLGLNCVPALIGYANENLL